MLKEPEATRRPDENDTQPVSGRGDDRLLLWCLVASLFINFGFGLWMNLADVYGTQRTKEEIKRAPLKIYHPPPVKKKPPPPKPKPKIPPKVMKIVHIQPRPTPPPPPQHFTVGSKSTAKTAVVVEQSAPPAPPTPTVPVAPITTPEPTKQITPPPTPPDPEVKVVPPKPTPPPPPPPPVHKPGYSEVAEQEADPLGDYPNPDVPQDADVTSLHPCTVSFTVSEGGRVTNVRVTGRSGNTDLDNACADAIRGMRFKPAIQDHYPQEQRMSHTFNFSG